MMPKRVTPEASKRIADIVTARLGGFGSMKDHCFFACGFALHAGYWIWPTLDEPGGPSR
jgi:hypothetical protein